jgi:hypothetical protein
VPRCLRGSILFPSAAWPTIVSHAARSFLRLLRRRFLRAANCPPPLHVHAAQARAHQVVRWRALRISSPQGFLLKKRKGLARTMEDMPNRNNRLHLNSGVSPASERRSDSEHPTPNIQHPTPKEEESPLGRWVFDVERWALMSLTGGLESIPANAGVCDCGPESDGLPYGANAVGRRVRDGGRDGAGRTTACVRRSASSFPGTGR